MEYACYKKKIQLYGFEKRATPISQLQIQKAKMVIILMNLFSVSNGLP